MKRNPSRRKQRQAPAARQLRLAAACLLCLATGPVLAQQAAATRAYNVTSSFGSTLSYTDTQGAAGPENGGQFVTRLSPGIQVQSRSGRIVGSLDYRLNANFYSRDKPAHPVDNALSAAFAIEAVPNFFFIDTRANITQQSLSAFGQQSAEGSLRANDNRTEVLNVQVSPYLRGPLGSVGNYEVRATAAATNGYRSIAADSTNNSGSFSLNSRNSRSVLGWSLQASQQRVDFRAGRATDTARGSAAVTAQPDPDLKLTLRGGQETTNVGAFERRRYDNWGGSVRWTPTERSVISIDGDRRYFGSGHQITFEHRLRRAVLRYTSTRDASSGSDANGVGQPVTLYRLYFTQFASLQPDPALRDQLVRDFLRAIGQNPDTVVAGGAITSAVTLQRRDDLSMAVVGQRTSLNLQAFSSSSQVIDNPTGAADANPVRQRGMIATLSHRVTPLSTASLTASLQKTLANPLHEGKDMQSLTVNWNSVLNAHTAAILSLRHSVFDSTIDSYRESALTASLSLRF